MSFIDYAILKRKAKFSPEYQWALNIYGKIKEEITEAKKKSADISDLLEKKAFNVSDHKDLLNLLFSNGLSPNVRDLQGNTLLHKNTYRSGSDNENNLKVIKFLIKKGCDIHALNNKEENLLFGASIEVAKFFIKKGVNVNQINSDGDNLILCNSYSRNIDRIKFYIEKGVAVDAVNKFGENLLFKVPEILLFMDSQVLNKIHKNAPKTNSGMNFLFPIFSSFSKNFMNTQYSGRRENAYEEDKAKFEQCIKKVEDYNIPVDYHAVDDAGNNLYAYCGSQLSFEILLKKGVPLHQINNDNHSMFDIIKERDFYKESPEVIEALVIALIEEERDYLKKNIVINSNNIHTSKARI